MHSIPNPKQASLTFKFSVKSEISSNYLAAKKCKTMQAELLLLLFARLRG